MSYELAYVTSEYRLILEYSLLSPSTEDVEGAAAKHSDKDELRGLLAAWGEEVRKG